METNTYTILEEKRTDVEKKLKRLQKKAQKYDIHLSYSYGEPYVLTIKRKNEYDYVVEYKYEVVDLTIESETIKKDGYTVIAHIEHSATGNIVNVFNGEMKTEWVHVEPFCEHCNSNHNLKYTFMVSNGNEIKQVGRTCLKEYCGIDPQVIGMVNAFYDEIDEYTPDGYDFREPLPCVYDSVEVLANAIDVVKEQGYIKSEERNSNKSVIGKRIAMGHPTEKSMKEAEEMAKAITNMSVEEAVEALLNNVQVRINGLYCKPSDFGYFAYAPVAYERHLKHIEEIKRRTEERNAIGAQSKYVGTIGERSTFEIKEIKMLTTLYGAYGETYLYRFIDTDGNVLIWFASTCIDDTATKIKATVKAHSERDGIKQTVLTRVKVA